MNRKEILLLSIGIFLTVIASVVADIYHLNLKSEVKAQDTVSRLENFKISPDLLRNLEQRSR